jgi:hypothetical protein
MNVPGIRLIVPLLCGLLLLAVPSSNAKEPEKAKPSPTPKSAERATTVNSTRSNTGTSNIPFKIGTAPGTTEADCTKKGGSVATGTARAKWCVIAAPGMKTCVVYKANHQGDDRYCSQWVGVQ